MKRTLVITLSLVMVLSAVAFAGPFIGADFSTESLDMSFGAKFEIIAIEIAFSDILVQTGSATLPSMDIIVTGTQTFGDVELEASVLLDYEEFAVWGVFPDLLNVTLGLEATVDLSAMLDTTWTVDLTGFVGLVLANTFVDSTYVWGVGIYVEMPWATVNAAGTE